MTLDGIWNLTCAAKGIYDTAISIPGDVFTALLNAKLILD
jgi:hypothetical protein